MLKYHILASGSNGNSTLLQSEGANILIDAGISTKRIRTHLAYHGLKISDLDFIMVTHAHTDHAKDLAVLTNQFSGTLLASQGTIDEIDKLQHYDLRYHKMAKLGLPLDFHETYNFGDIRVTAIPTTHDIQGSCGFRVEDIASGINLTHITDTGDISPQLERSMKTSQLLALESNHDLDMLKMSRRPASLKKRIRETHMNNDETFDLLRRVITKKTQAVYLIHLSGECNSVDQVLRKVATAKHVHNINSCGWVLSPRTADSAIFTGDEESYELEGGITDMTVQLEKYLKGSLTSYF